MFQAHDKHVYVNDSIFHIYQSVAFSKNRERIMETSTMSIFKIQDEAIHKCKFDYCNVNSSF